MNRVIGSGTADKVSERGQTAHPFAEQGKLLARAARNQAETFWTESRPAAKTSAPAIGTIEGPKGSFS